MSSSLVIIGGGVMGCAAAWFLARHHGVHATVLERDPTYRTASSALSASSIRQQFSTPVNIALSQASLELMRPWLHELAFVEAGYLYLASAAAPGITVTTLTPSAALDQAGINSSVPSPCRAWAWRSGVSVAAATKAASSASASSGHGSAACTSSAE